MRLGAHESVAGGLINAFERGRDDGCEAIQIFARPKAQWRAPLLVEEDVRAFRKAARAHGWPLLSHTSYLINLGATDEAILEKSVATLADEMDRAEALGLDYVVLHPGAHLGLGPDAGVKRVAGCLSEVMEHTRGYHARLLLEITAGQGSCLGCSFEEIGQLLERTHGGHAMGVCFDTCHAFSAGYDLSTNHGYDEVFAAFDQRIGLANLRAFHLNDSKTVLGSGVDRHEEIGDGTLGLLPFWRLVNDPRFADVPAVLETPSGPDKETSFARNLKRLRKLIGAAEPRQRPKPPAITGRTKKTVATNQASFAGLLDPEQEP
ncbi:MAG TPA: deoxyribonuclease IV [Polyangia bacterium]